MTELFLFKVEWSAKSWDHHSHGPCRGDEEIVAENEEQAKLIFDLTEPNTNNVFSEATLIDPMSGLFK